jgi:hypothetical protein
MEQIMLRNTQETLRHLILAFGFIASLCAAHAVQAADSLIVGQSMTPGQYLESTNGSYRFNFQTDGNLVLRRKSDQTALWASGSNGDGGTRLTLQSSGNLALFTSGGSVVWSTGTSNAAANRLTMQGDGNLVLYNTSGSAYWATNTVDTQPPSSGGVSYIGFSKNETTASTLSIARASATRAGDLLILITQGGDGQLPDTQSGWTRFSRCFERGNSDTSCSDSGVDMGLIGYYRIASTDGSASYSLNRGQSGHIVAGIFVLRGANNASPVYSHAYLPNDSTSAESHCPSTAGISGGQHICIYSHDDPQSLTGFGGLSLLGQAFSAGDSVHFTSAKLSAGGNTPYIRARNEGSTDGGNNDLQLSIVIRPK